MTQGNHSIDSGQPEMTPLEPEKIAPAVTAETSRDKRKDRGASHGHKSGGSPPRPLLTGADVYVVAIAGVLVAVIVSGNFLKLIRLMYDPIVVLVVISISVTYLFFKSSDRSRAYKQELEHVKALRKEDVARKRRIEERLEKFRAAIERDGNLTDEKKKASRKQIQDIIDELRES